MTFESLPRVYQTTLEEVRDFGDHLQKTESVIQKTAYATGQIQEKTQQIQVRLEKAPQLAIAAQANLSPLRVDMLLNGNS